MLQIVPVTLSKKHVLTVAEIDRVITRKSPGVYVCADALSNRARWTGRSDSDVAARLKQHCGEYAAFWFAYATSPKDAFEKECNLWHQFSPTDTTVHPQRPVGADWKCPVCRHFG